MGKHKVDSKDLQPAGSKSTSSSGGRAVSPVTLDRGQMEAGWDVSADPELQKVLNKARMLGQAKPVKIQQVSKTPQFNLSADQIRKANELFLDIVKGRSGNLYTVSIRQSIEDTEEEIVQRSVEGVDNLFMMDKNLQAKLGIKVDQTGRSL